MIKNKLDFKLINTALLVLIIYLLYKTGLLWMGVTDKVLKIFGPFFFAFAAAYAFYPMLEFLERKKVPKSIAVFLIILLVIGTISIVAILVAPLLFNQLSSLFTNIISFLKEMSMNYDWNVGPLQDSLSKSFNEIITNLGKLISDGAISMIDGSMNVLSTVVIAFSAAIYFLIDMKEIRHKVGKYLRRKSKRTYQYAKILDDEMKRYLTGFIKIVFITLIEYTFAFYVIGHPNAVLLGFLAAIATLIPYFGGMITNCIAVITAFVVSPSLFIRTIIAFFVLSSIDGYLINPFVYGKTNSVHPIIVILSVFAGGILFGVVGIIISLPVSIILIATYKFYKQDVLDKIEDIKDAKKEEIEAPKKKEK